MPNENIHLTDCKTQKNIKFHRELAHAIEINEPKLIVDTIYPATLDTSNKNLKLGSGNFGLIFKNGNECIKSCNVVADNQADTTLDGNKIKAWTDLLDEGQINSYVVDKLRKIVIYNTCKTKKGQKIIEKNQHLVQNLRSFDQFKQKVLSYDKVFAKDKMEVYSEIYSNFVRICCVRDVCVFFNDQSVASLGLAMKKKHNYKEAIEGLIYRFEREKQGILDFRRIEKPKNCPTSPKDKGQKNFKNCLSTVAVTMAAGIYQLHCCGLTHNDVAMRNYLFDEHFNAYICDFGLTTAHCEETKNHFGKKLGESDYLKFYDGLDTNNSIEDELRNEFASESEDDDENTADEAYQSIKNKFTGLLKFASRYWYPPYFNCGPNAPDIVKMFGNKTAENIILQPSELTDYYALGCTYAELIYHIFFSLFDKHETETVVRREDIQKLIEVNSANDGSYQTIASKKIYRDIELNELSSRVAFNVQKDFETQIPFVIDYRKARYIQITNNNINDWTYLHTFKEQYPIMLYPYMVSFLDLMQVQFIGRYIFILTTWFRDANNYPFGILGKKTSSGFETGFDGYSFGNRSLQLTRDLQKGKLSEEIFHQIEQDADACRNSNGTNFGETFSQQLRQDYEKLWDFVIDSNKTGDRETNKNIEEDKPAIQVVNQNSISQFGMAGTYGTHQTTYEDNQSPELPKLAMTRDEYYGEKPSELPTRTPLMNRDQYYSGEQPIILSLSKPIPTKHVPPNKNPPSRPPAPKVMIRNEQSKTSENGSNSESLGLRNSLSLPSRISNNPFMQSDRQNRLSRNISGSLKELNKQTTLPLKDGEQNIQKPKIAKKPNKKPLQRKKKLATSHPLKTNTGVDFSSSTKLRINESRNLFTGQSQ